LKKMFEESKKKFSKERFVRIRYNHLNPDEIDKIMSSIKAKGSDI
jgi:hypothetical protein